MNRLLKNSSIKLRLTLIIMAVSCVSVMLTTLAISAIGAYAINGSMMDLYLILFFGIVGYVFDKVDIPVAPLVLSLVLGGIMEQSFRQAMTISGGNPKIFFNSPITIALVVLSVISILTPLVLARVKAFRGIKVAEAE